MMTAAPTETEQVTVVLAEDHELFAQALRTTLEHSGRFTVRECVSDGDALVDSVRRWQPDLVLTDLSMRPVGGLDATRTICEEDPEAKVVILSAFTDRHLVRDAVNAGAVGYVAKCSSGAKIVEHLLDAAAGQPAFDRTATQVLVDTARNGTSNLLSERQLEVLELLGRGNTYREIAEHLFVAPSTVKSHASACFAALGVSNSKAAVRRATELGLLRSHSVI